VHEFRYFLHGSILDNEHNVHQEYCPDDISDRTSKATLAILFFVSNASVITQHHHK
jgi:hypothetical protein